jgi:hypothetical protein
MQEHNSQLKLKEQFIEEKLRKKHILMANLFQQIVKQDKPKQILRHLKMKVIAAF